MTLYLESKKGVQAYSCMLGENESNQFKTKPC